MILLGMFAVLFQFIAEAACKEIIVSKNSAIMETLVICGTTDNPCQDLSYAMSLTQEGDVLTVDGGEEGAPYFYTVRSVIAIRHSIFIRKKISRYTELPNPTIYIDKNINMKNNFIFECHNSINVTGLNFYLSLNVRSAQPFLVWFYLKPVQMFISIDDCYFYHGNLFTSDETLLANQDMIDIQVNSTRIPEYLFTGRNTSVAILSQWIVIPIIFYFTIFNNRSFLRNLSVSNQSVRISNIKKRNSYHKITVANSTFKHSVLNNIGCCIDIIGCVFDNSPVRLLHQRYGHIIDTVFANLSESWMSPALLIYRGRKINYRNTKIIRCSFQNNSPLKDLIPVISVPRIFLTSTIELIDTDIHSPSKEVILLDAKERFSKLKDLSIYCGKGYILKILSSSSDMYSNDIFRLTCVPCKKGFYTIKKYHLKISTRHRWMKIDTNQNEVCQICPQNGICEDDMVRSKGQYWGYNETLKSITFLPCPVYYCCSSLQQCLSYDTCAKNRRGRLCSMCIDGYSCSFNEKHECVSDDECHNAVVGLCTVCVFTTFLIMVMLYQRELAMLIKRLVKQRQSNESNENDSLELQDLQISLVDSNTTTLVVYQELQLPPSGINEETYKSPSTIVSGSIKILFFFYQTASIIRIQSPGKMSIPFPKMFDFMSTFFSVRINLSYSKLPLCLIPNLGVIQTEVLKLSTIWIALLFLLFIWIAANIYHWFFCKENNSKHIPCEISYVTINEDVPSYCKLPILTRIKCTYLQLLLISFAGISTFCFNAIFCVNINNSSYLYQQASIKCYQPWQYFIIAVVLLWIIPFFVVLYIASKLLHRCKITQNQFLITLAFPPLIVPLLIKLQSHHHQIGLTKANAMEAKHLLLVLSEPFKAANTRDGMRLCWESVLLLRRMLLVAMKTFIMSPVTKLYPMVIILIVFTIHHVLVEPFVEPISNKLEFVSLSILISLVFVNMFWAVTQEYNLMMNTSYRVLGIVLLYYEMAILSLPIALALLYLLGSCFKRCLVFCKTRWVMTTKQD